MAVPTPKIVSTPEAIASTIETDFHVFSWFQYLILQPCLKARLDASPENRALFTHLKKIIFWQMTASLIGAGLFLIGIISRQYIYLAGWFLLIYPMLRLMIQRRKTVAQLGTRLLQLDYSAAELCQKTIFQIGEFYNRQYQTISLMEMIHQLDTWGRQSLMGGFLLFILIYSFTLTFKLMIITGAVSYFILINSIRLTLLYALSRPPQDQLATK